MKAMNVNLVKVALTISEFFKDVTGSHDYALDPLAMQRFDELLGLARKYEIRLMVQPPNHWGGGGWGKGQWAEEEIAAFPGLVRSEWPEDAFFYPETDFEKQWKAEGKIPQRLRAMLAQPQA